MTNKEQKRENVNVNFNQTKEKTLLNQFKIQNLEMLLTMKS